MHNGTGLVTFLSVSLDPGITIGMLNNLVGHLLDVTLDFWIGELATDEALGGKQGVLWVDNGLSLGGNTDQPLTIFGKANDRGRCASSWQD